MKDTLGALVYNLRQTAVIEWSWQVISAAVYHIVAKDFRIEAQPLHQSQDTLKYCCLNTVEGLWDGAKYSKYCHKSLFSKIAAIFVVLHLICCTSLDILQ